MKPRRVAVAYSGGRDSTALLHVTACAAAALKLQVVALHIHHGLMPAAEGWLAHCQTMCKRWAECGLPVSFQAQRLSGRPAKGESVEGWAREGRLAALSQIAKEQGASILLLGHHRRDQAETFLLQALRGGGMAGLAGMPAHAERDGVVWARPWLNMPRETIEAYVRRHRLEFIEDESNLDTRFARNRLRSKAWLELLVAFPQAEGALADAAARAAQAVALIDEVGGEDLHSVSDGGRLNLVAWRRLSPQRRYNALRLWLRREGALQATLLERLASELMATRPACWPLDGQRELRAYRGRLEAGRRWDTKTEHQALAELSITSPGVYGIPGWSGRLHVRRVEAGGVSSQTIALLRAMPRTGGEQFQLRPGGIPRSIKKQYQAKAVPAWERHGPLLWAGNRLVFAPGLGVDARVLAHPREAQYELRWEPKEVAR